MEYTKVCYLCDSIFMGKTPVYSEEETPYKVLGQKNNQKTGIDLNGIKYLTKDFYEGRKDNEFLKNGDILLNSLGGGSVGRIGFYNLKDNEYLTDGHLIIYRPNESTNNKFLYYCLYSKQKELEDMAVGSTNQCFLNVSDIYKMPVPSPSTEEQVRIADFLDKKVYEIDAVISKTKESIEEYKKLKQSIITEAVTKGLDPNVEMKDSGIEWIGSIPKHWSIQKFKNLGKCRNGLTYSPEDQCGEEGVLVLRSSNIQNDKLCFDDCVYVNKEIPEELYVKPGDILICSRNGSAKLIGKNAIIPDNLIASFGAFMMIYRCECPDYLRYVLNSNIFSYYLGTFLTVSVNQLTGGNFNNIQFPFTPDKEEQKKIINYLDVQCSKYDVLISKKEQTITELEQYKKSLIYEYVTGKKEVA